MEHIGECGYTVSQVDAWCAETFGQSRQLALTHASWRITKYGWLFKNYDDAVAMLMVWG